MTIAWRIGAWVEGTEAGDAQGGQRTEFPLSLKEKFRAGCKRWLGRVVVMRISGGCCSVHQPQRR